MDNLAFSCQGCNAAKHTKISGYDPFTKQTVLLYHPRQERWQKHFAWSEDFLRVIGLTPTGRASIYVLQLNREPLMNFRMALRAIGQHPPKLPEE